MPCEISHTFNTHSGQHSGFYCATPDNPKIASSIRGSRPHLNVFCPTGVTPKRHLDWFSVYPAARLRVFSVGRTTPKNCSFPFCGIWPHLIHGSVGPSESPLSGMSIGSAVFVGLTNVTNRHTDRLCRVAIAAATYTMRPKMITWYRRTLCHGRVGDADSHTRRGQQMPQNQHPW